ncbi:MAG: hypothetical protein ABIL62_04040 [Planctomycetota bacterium]
MRRRMTHSFVGVEAGIGTGSSTLDARRKASFKPLLVAGRGIDTSIDNLKQKLHFRHSKL